MAKTKKVYWSTVLTENYRFQYQATRDAEPVQRTGTLTFSQTYGTGVKDNGKKILVLSLRYPVGPILAIPGIACDHIDRIWKFQIDDLSGETGDIFKELCEVCDEGLITPREAAKAMIRQIAPIDKKLPYLDKRVTPWTGKSGIRTLTRYLEEGLAEWFCQDETKGE